MKDKLDTIKRTLPYLAGLVFIASLLFVVFKCSEKRLNRDIENGVYSIMTIEATGASPFCGFALKYSYVFHDQYYEGIAYKDMGSDIGIGPLSTADVGKRYFLKVSVSNPHESRIMHNDLVPDWFTLDAPDEGWPTKPTEAELREMMVQDSLRRGSNYAQ